MTYAELAEHFGIGPDGARMKAKRRKWRIVQNHPMDLVRVEVPLAFLAERTPADTGERVPMGTVPDVCEQPPGSVPNAPERSGLLSLADVRVMMGEALDRQAAQYAEAMARQDIFHSSALAQWRTRAETAEQQVAQLVNAIINRFPEPAAPAAPEAGAKPWWWRWFGASTRSTLKS
jgi:hypothetical protein